MFPSSSAVIVLMKQSHSLLSQFLIMDAFFCICYIIIFCHKNAAYLHFKVVFFFTSSHLLFADQFKCGLPQMWPACFRTTACCIPPSTKFFWVCHLCHGSDCCSCSFNGCLGYSLQYHLHSYNFFMFFYFASKYLLVYFLYMKSILISLIFTSDTM